MNLLACCKPGHLTGCGDLLNTCDVPPLRLLSRCHRKSPQNSALPKDRSLKKGKNRFLLPSDFQTASQLSKGFIRVGDNDIPVPGGFVGEIEEAQYLGITYYGYRRTHDIRLTVF